MTDIQQPIPGEATRTFPMDTGVMQDGGTISTRIGIATGVPPVHVALARVARKVGAVAKSGRADPAMGGYSFRKYDDIVDAIHEAMAEEGVIPFYEMLEPPLHKEWSAKMHLLTLKVRFDFIGPAGDKLSTVVWCEALDNGDKGIGKAISYALKDLLTRMLTLPFGPAADNEAPVTASYEDGYERTYDGNTVDPPEPKLIGDDERDGIRARIGKLSEEQAATLKERWGNLTKANALPPLQLLRPHDLPVIDDLLKNVESPPPGAPPPEPPNETVPQIDTETVPETTETKPETAVAHDDDATPADPGRGEACVICGSTRSKLVSVAGQWRCQRASACADRVASLPGTIDVQTGSALSAPSVEALATAAKFDCPHGDDGCVAPETCNEWNTCAEKPA